MDMMGDSFPYLETDTVDKGSVPHKAPLDITEPRRNAGPPATVKPL